MELGRKLARNNLTEKQESRAWKHFPLEHWQRTRIRIEPDHFHQIPHPGGGGGTLERKSSLGSNPNSPKGEKSKGYNREKKRVSFNLVHQPNVVEKGFETQNLVAI